LLVLEPDPAVEAVVIVVLLYVAPDEAGVEVVPADAELEVTTTVLVLLAAVETVVEVPLAEPVAEAEPEAVAEPEMEEPSVEPDRPEMWKKVEYWMIVGSETSWISNP